MMVVICLVCINCLLVMLGLMLWIKFMVIRVEAELKVVEMEDIIVASKLVIIKLRIFEGSSCMSSIG